MAKIDSVLLLMFLLVILIASNAKADAINALVLDKVNCDGIVYVVGSNDNFNLTNNCVKLNSTWECKCTRSIMGNFSEKTDLFIQYFIKNNIDNPDSNKRVFHKTITMPTIITIVENTAVNAFPKLLLIASVGIAIVVIFVIIIIVVVPMLKKAALEHAEEEGERRQATYKDMEKLLEDIKNGSK